MDALPLAEILLAAKVLSGLVLLLFLIVLVDLWRRPAIPEFSYGSVTLSQTRLRWVWFAVLMGALGVGVNEDPVVRSTSDWTDPEAGTVEGAARTPSAGRTVRSTMTVPLPFYRYERERTSRDGRLVQESVLEGVVLPWPLLGALVAYWVLVVRWNPDSRWARRILEGKRRGAPPG